MPLDFNIMEPNFSKSPNGLLPAIVQDAKTKTVLMLGYMNAAAYRQTLDTQKVTFYSRSKERLWTKGEESGHVLELVECKLDCDCDSFLITAHPKGQHVTKEPPLAGGRIIFPIMAF